MHVAPQKVERWFEKISRNDALRNLKAKGTQLAALAGNLNSPQV